jgi:hypothetical protein
LKYVCRCFLNLHWLLEILGRNVVVKISFVVSCAVGEFLSHLIRDLAEVDKVVSDIDQFGSGVGSEARDLNSTAFVRNSVNGIDEIFIA